jgi:hypothetical protein
LKLSVAKRASVASCGSVGVSSARRNQNRLGARGDHVFDRGDLTGVIAVELARRGEQLGAILLRSGLCTLTHLHEERVGVGFGDQADDGLVSDRQRGACAPYGGCGDAQGGETPGDGLPAGFLIHGDAPPDN